MAPKFKVSVLLNVVRKKNYWIAFCPALKTFGYSNESKEKALQDFEDAIKTFVYFQDKLGKTDETLRTLGWHKVGTPQLSSPELRLPPGILEKRYRGESVETVEREIAFA